MFFTLVVLTLSLQGVLSQFPKVCTTSKALKDRCCCPTWRDGSMCGADSGRGVCRFISQPRTQAKSLDKQNDDRLEWPHEYFDSMCVCKSRYHGFDCGDCMFGWTGAKCDKKKDIIRKEIRQLSPTERVKFFSYLSLAKVKKSARFSILTSGNRFDRNTFRFVEASVYDVGAWMRYYAYKPILRNNLFNVTTTFATRGPGFLTWHRWFLLFLEREIQILTGDDTFSMPYYDWSVDAGTCHVCNNDYMGKTSSDGVLTSSSYFGSWRSICSGYYYDYKYCPVAEDGCKMEPLQRSPGTDPTAPTMPTAKDVEEALKWETYDTPPYDHTSTRSFRNIVEGYMSPTDGTTESANMNLLVRLYMGGSMAQDTICSADPLFLLHQAYIDKIYERWIQRKGATNALYPRSGIPGQDPEENIVPSIPTMMNKEFMNKAESFGYSYSDYPTQSLKGATYT
ncbi:tyrosinase-like [Ambystoma mexicanum]|uniref:tyrosinase-like n=1 Tax=Ambystoma mexicanum TaxID=8296 RepID=UPI0037E7DEE8